MLKAGDVVEDFELEDQTGARVSLSGLLRSGPVVLFFYPKAMTTGCTRESCHFRDLASEFAATGAQRVGISADTVERQARFDDQHGLGYPLLSDADRRVARLFGVKRPGPLMNRRATFVIDEDRRVLGAFASEVDMNVHADKALEVLRSRVA
jgi:peroxiredoxin Q/BCP